MISIIFFFSTSVFNFVIQFFQVALSYLRFDISLSSWDRVEAEVKGGEAT